MALFGKEDNGDSAMARSSSNASPDQLNMVGEGTVFEGTLRAKSNVRVSGHIKGKIDVQGRAIVTQEGVVEGELHATDADVAGSVQGEMHVAERLTLKSTARIDGNIVAARIRVEEGALFSGQCEIGEQVAEKVQEQVGGQEPRRNAEALPESGRGGEEGSSKQGSPGGEAGEKASPDPASSKKAVGR